MFVRTCLPAVMLAVALAGAQSEGFAETRLRPAITKAIELIQTSNRVWDRKQTCASCHHQVLPSLLFDDARRRGFRVDEEAAKTVARKVFDAGSLDDAVQSLFQFNPPFDTGMLLVGAHAAGMAPSLTTAAHARMVSNDQRADGSWMSADSRPPQTYGAWVATAYAVRALQLYMHPRLADERNRRMARARQWLLTATPRNTDDLTMRLFGLTWGGAGREEIARCADELVLAQQSDGGWAQLPGYASDAYATGQALTALAESGAVGTSASPYVRGLDYLLRTRREDGTWLVRTRIDEQSFVSPPYFETGFPYGKHQITSMMGTLWAARAMLKAIPETEQQPRLATVPVAEQDQWMEVALFGTADELRGLLDKGLNPNIATPQGTTILMMAAHDLAKTRLLIERGADVNAKSKTRYTALMVAAMQRGTTDVVRLLLERGAEAVPKPPLPRHAGSPVFFAAWSGETEKVRVLLDRGAKPDTKMNIFGIFAVTPLLHAIARNDTQMISFLLENGADVHRRDNAGISPLVWAVLSNRPEAAKLLLRHGARIEDRDPKGFTPLMRATTTDFGDTAMMETLLAAGANPRATNKSGETALAVAKRLHHASMVKVLESVPANQRAAR